MKNKRKRKNTEREQNSQRKNKSAPEAVQALSQTAFHIPAKQTRRVLVGRQQILTFHIIRILQDIIPNSHKNIPRMMIKEIMGIIMDVAWNANATVIVVVIALITVVVVVWKIPSAAWLVSFGQF